MTGKYILDGKTPVASSDLLAWGRWMESANRKVAADKVGDATISTVFLGLDHCFGEGPPLLFETMIFGGEHNDYQTRASTWTEAEAQHAAALALVNAPTLAPAERKS